MVIPGQIPSCRIGRLWTTEPRPRAGANSARRSASKRLTTTRPRTARCRWTSQACWRCWRCWRRRSRSIPANTRGSHTPPCLPGPGCWSARATSRFISHRNRDLPRPASRVETTGRQPGLPRRHHSHASDFAAFHPATSALPGVAARSCSGCGPIRGTPSQPAEPAHRQSVPCPDRILRARARTAPRARRQAHVRHAWRRRAEAQMRRAMRQWTQCVVDRLAMRRPRHVLCGPGFSATCCRAGCPAAAAKRRCRCGPRPSSRGRPRACGGRAEVRQAPGRCTARPASAPRWA